MGMSKGGRMGCGVGVTIAVLLALGACSETPSVPGPAMGMAGSAGSGVVQADEPCEFDADGDGYCSPFYYTRSTKLDCDDSDAERHPGAPERLNALDDNCDGIVDEGLSPECQLTVVAPAGGCETVVDLVAGESHACVLTSAKRVLCWGWNTQGQLGVSGLRSSPVPVAVPGVTGASAIASGAQETCALVGEQAICWGGGVGLPFHVPLPAETASIAVSGRIYALDANGQLWQRPFLAGVAAANAFAPLTLDVATLSSGAITCALDKESNLSCWDAQGVQLKLAGGAVQRAQGNGSQTLCFVMGNDLYCQTPDGAPTKIPGNGTAVTWAVSETFGCAADESGKAACWTDGAPTKLQGVSKLVAGAQFGCALGNDGTVSCFGRSDGGWLGAGSSAPGTSAELLALAPGADRPLTPIVLLGSDSLGACDTQGDVKELAKPNEILKQLPSCREMCQRQLDPSACLASCVMLPDGLSPDCRACFTTLAACTGDGCHAAFQDCVGFPVDSLPIPGRFPSLECVGAGCQPHKQVGETCTAYEECTCAKLDYVSEEQRVCVALGGCGGKGYLTDGTCRRACGPVGDYCGAGQACRLPTTSPAVEPAYCQ